MNDIEFNILGETFTDSDLLKLSNEEIKLCAKAVRLDTTSNRLTYSPKVFIPLTRLCNDRCGYCTFATAPARLDSPYMSLEEVLAIARKGAASGCYEALFTLGERPEERYEVAKTWLHSNGFTSTVEYLKFVAGETLKETGLLPHINAGALNYSELESLKTVSISQGMMLESIVDDLNCHKNCPDKTVARRLATLDAAGQLHIPFTTGILVGIGDSRRDRLNALIKISEFQQKYGNIQEVIVQNFLPKPKTKMQDWPQCDVDEFLYTIALARVVLPPSVRVQAPPNLIEDARLLIEAGIDDFGGVSPVTIDHVNPENSWPEIKRLESISESLGFNLAPRLTAYPKFINEFEPWIDTSLKTAVLHASDGEGLARDSMWSSGGTYSPENLIPLGEYSSTKAYKSQVSEILDGVIMGNKLSEKEIVTLFQARGNDVIRIGEIANELRSQIVGEEITWIANRNINYTNICTFKCRFCAFSKGPLSLNLRGDPYLLSFGEIAKRAKEAEDMGATEVCLQGGIHPNFDGEYYLEVLRSIKAVAPSLHLHAFSALEVSEGAKRLSEDLKTYLTRLKDAGLKSLPGTAAEILDDDVRKILCPDKIKTDEWLEVHKVAHEVGLTSNVTIMFGSIENYNSIAKHLILTKQLAAQTHGFLEFVPLPFVHMAAPIYLRGLARRGPTFREALLMHSIGRIVYQHDIPNVQVSWVKLGISGARQVLNAGANDMGGTLIDENISRSAGAEHGQSMNEEDFEAVVSPLSRPLVRRNTHYKKLILT